jgi:hypothetical protein
MIAYSTTDQVLYATDGCNSCTRRVRMNLGTLPSSELRELAANNELRPELLEKLVNIVKAGM